MQGKAQEGVPEDRGVEALAPLPFMPQIHMYNLTCQFAAYLSFRIKIFFGQ